MYHAVIKSQFKDISIYVFILDICLNLQLHRHATNIKRIFFASHFLNVNISVSIKHSHLRFSVLILNIIREGMMSHIFFIIIIWPSSHFMRCRKYC